MNNFRLADKDGSGTLTKKECRELLINSLNAEISNDVFERYFNV
jgi:Ca2+-binding EF-hand superfamily protein